jgi:2-(1,2-epoxy-1,2-dihydrophenyl)acetyl-CoA isomerase
MSGDIVLVEIGDNGVARITLNDPPSLNAFNATMGARLVETFAELDANPAVRAAILTGAGRGFCSGANLAQRFNALESGAADTGAVLEQYVNPLVASIPQRRVPLVSAVNGPAAGVGLSLALLGDVIIAAESAFFLLAFSRIGLVPDGGATYLLPRRIGLTRATEMALLAERIPAKQALDWGMINRVVPDAELAAAADAMALRLAQGPASLARTRQLMLNAMANTLDAQLDAELANQRWAGGTEDFREGVAAFLAKRPAVFAGR